MKFQPHFLRSATLSIASLLLIVAVAALLPVCATTSQGESEAERSVLLQLQKGEIAKPFCSTVPEAKCKLSAAFIVKLLTGGYEQVRIDPHGSWLRSDWLTHPNGISIGGAVIAGNLKLINQEVPYDIYFWNCTFEGYVDLTDSRFAKRLFFTGSKFKGEVTFAGATIGLDLHAERSHFADGASFNGMRVGRNVQMTGATFDSFFTRFDRAQVDGLFSADGSKFHSKYTSFDYMRVNGDFSARDCTFSYQEGELEKGESKVSFSGAHFADFFLNGSSFDTVSAIDFTRMQADLASFDGVQFKSPSDIKLQRMVFKLVSPVNADAPQFLRSLYNGEFYTALETSWRTHGYHDEADKIFIAKKRAERRESCKDFFRQCNRSGWAWSVFQDGLAGYGKSLQNLLGWSLGFLVIGTLIFRKEKGMRIKDPKDAPHYAGRYHAFWYSLDLFLPIIKLGEADVWTPKDDRRWANLYRRLHIIIGSLFVPIGLAAWTGIIK